MGWTALDAHLPHTELTSSKVESQIDSNQSGQASNCTIISRTLVSPGFGAHGEAEDRSLYGPLGEDLAAVTTTSSIKSTSQKASTVQSHKNEKNTYTEQQCHRSVKKWWNLHCWSCIYNRLKSHRALCRRSFLVITSKVFGPIWVLFAVCLIFEVVVVYFAFALRLSKHSIRFQIAQTVLGLFLLFNLLLSYYQAVTIDPGLPPTYNEVQESIEDGTFHSRYSFDLPMVVCRKCSRVKAPRTHHCSICMRCVIRMDHHCPWLNQCVGFYNYRPFFLFLFWLFAGSLFAGVSIDPIVIPSLVNKVPWPLSHIPYSEELSLAAAILSTAICIASFILFSFHLFLVLMNQTTLESQISSLNSKTYNISPWINMRQVLGPAAFPFCLLPWCSGPSTVIGNSVRFPRLIAE